MKTVYDIYHWSHPDACAELTRGYGSREQAADALFAIANVPHTATWVRVRNDNGWVINPNPVTGRQTEWGVFERQEAETDAELGAVLLGVAEFTQNLIKGQPGITPWHIVGLLDAAGEWLYHRAAEPDCGG